MSSVIKRILLGVGRRKKRIITGNSSSNSSTSAPINSDKSANLTIKDSNSPSPSASKTNPNDHSPISASCCPRSTPFVQQENYSSSHYLKERSMDETTSLLENAAGDTTTDQGGTDQGGTDNKLSKGLSWSQSLMSTYIDEHNDITTAAFLLRDAIILSKATSLFAHTDYLITTNPITGSGASRNGCSKLTRKILTNTFVTNLLSFCIIALVTVSFIEPPNWCRNFQSTTDPSMVGCSAALYIQGITAFYVDDTEDEIQYYYPSIRSDYLNANQAFVVEFIIVSLLCLHTLLCIAKDGFSLTNYLMLTVIGPDVDKLTSSNMKNVRIFRMIRFVSLILLAKGLVGQLLSTSSEIRPLAIYLRILLFISFSEGVQREILIALEIIPSLVSVGVVLFMVIAFYGMIGVVAFYGTKEGKLHFSNWVEGIWTLWTSMTTVIYPDVMMAGYNENRFVALYFITFMMFTFFFMLNVILAIVANGYNSSNDAREVEISETRTNYLKLAFDLLTKKSGLDHVTHDQLMAMFLVLNEECDEIPRVPDNKAEILFAVLDQDGSDILYLDEFMNFSTVMLLQFEEVKPTWLEMTFPSVLDSEKYLEAREIVASASFDYAIDMVILVNAILVIAQSYPMLAGHTVVENEKLQDGMIDTPGEVAETLFTIVYVFEMASKILLLGWKNYSSSVRNLFDGFITIMAVGSMLLVYYPNGYNNTHLVRFVVMARVVRIFRLFLVIKPFRIISRTFVGVLPAAARVALLLFCLVYVFSAIGMQLYGGLFTRDPNNPKAYVVEGTDYADAFFWANNFNDLLSGMNVCFNLLVINNWNEMETGLIAISSKWSRYYFFTFFIFGVIIVNNLVVAIVIDYFFSELEEAEKEELAKEEESKQARSGLTKLKRGGTQLFFDGQKLPEGKNQRQYVASVGQGLTAAKQKSMLSKLIP